MKIRCSKANATVVESEQLTAGAQKIFTVEFEFNSSWTGLERAAVFKSGNVSRTQRLDETNICEIPHEVLRAEQTLYVGVYGSDSTGVVLPSVWCSLGKVEAAAELSEEAVAPTPSVYQQMIDKEKELIAASNQLREDAEEKYQSVVAGIAKAADYASAAENSAKASSGSAESSAASANIAESGAASAIAAAQSAIEAATSEAPSIVCRAEGTELIYVQDSAGRPAAAFRVIGKTGQEGTPTPDAPLPLRCVKAGTKVNICGKNLFNIGKPMEHQEVGCTVTVNGARITASQSVVGTYKCGGMTIDSADALIGKTLTLSVIGKTNGNGNNGAVRVAWASRGNPAFHNQGTTDISLTFASSAAEKKSVTFVLTEKPSGADRLNILFYSNYSRSLSEAKTYSAEYSDIQLEVSDTATDFEPYISGGAFETPCDLYEGDIYYPLSGEVERYTHIGKVTDGSINWMSVVSPNQFFIEYSAVGGNGSNRVSGTVRSTHYSSSNTDTYYCENSDGIYIKDISVSTVEEFEEKLYTFDRNGAPVYFCYKLKTPIVENYNPQTLSLPRKTVTVAQSAAELTADMDMEYVADTKMYIDNKFLELQSALLEALAQ